jgi:Protein of unknown function (DUF3179)
MRDEETGSFWQQINGTAVAGPLKGSKLSLVQQDELTFDQWKEEHPKGTVLAPVARDAAHYEKANWESEIQKLPTVIHAPKGTLRDRETILGVTINGAARAYPLSKLTVESPVLLDDVGGKPIMLVLGPDGQSVRVFSREMGTKTLDFYGQGMTGTSEPWALLESTSLDEWGFDGCAITGDARGQCLARIDVLKDFWFDWQHYHPNSDIYRH